MRTITFVLTEDATGLYGTVAVEPEITWPERCTTEIERVAQAMRDTAFEYGLELKQRRGPRPPAQGEIYENDYI